MGRSCNTPINIALDEKKLVSGEGINKSEDNGVQ